MKSIIIVDCISTGKNFIKDIIRRNYKPVILEPKFDSRTPEEVAKRREWYIDEYATIDEEYDLIFEQDTFEEQLKWLKNLILN